MKKSLTDLEKLELVKEYQSGASVKFLMDKYFRSRNAIKNLLKRRGVEIRKDNLISNKKYTLNENYFDNIDSEDKAYFLGFLYADGNNFTKRNCITLNLAEIDKHILEEFQKKIETDRPITVYDRGDNRNYMSCAVVINSIHMSKVLSDLGCVNNKTFKINFPEWLDKSLIKHFVRGYFDGDGSISITTKTRQARIGIIGTDVFCRKIKEIINDEIEITPQIRKAKKESKNNTVELYFGGNYQVIKFMNWIYKDSNIFLKRKFDKFINLKNIVKENENKPERKCSVCDSKYFSKNYCSKHYYEFCGGKEKRKEYYLKNKNV